MLVVRLSLFAKKAFANIHGIGQHRLARALNNKIREPNDWKPMCSSYIKSNNISVLAMFQGLI